MSNEDKSQMETGKLVLERIGERTKLTRCFSKYPLKFIVPNKVGPSETDAVWIYTLNYGGGIVSGDSISFGVTVGNGCTAVLTTQSSTKVYKSVGSKCSEQIMEATIGHEALLAVIPDPVTCFSTARYNQIQNFKVMADSSLLLVDWISSGRHERGEKWSFAHYKSINHIILENNDPIFLDKMLLEQEGHCSISSRLQGYQSVAMIVLLGPKLKHIQMQIQDYVKKLLPQQLGLSSSNLSDSKPCFLASASTFGPQGNGVVVRVASTTTESIYTFLQKQLAGMETLLGASPYC